jgi:hypothetical protein
MPGPPVVTSSASHVPIGGLSLATPELRPHHCCRGCTSSAVGCRMSDRTWMRPSMWCQCPRAELIFLAAPWPQFPDPQVISVIPGYAVFADQDGCRPLTSSIGNTPGMTGGPFIQSRFMTPAGPHASRNLSDPPGAGRPTSRRQHQRARRGAVARRASA